MDLLPRPIPGGGRAPPLSLPQFGPKDLLKRPLAHNLALDVLDDPPHVTGKVPLFYAARLYCMAWRYVEV